MGLGGALRLSIPLLWERGLKARGGLRNILGGEQLSIPLLWERGLKDIIKFDQGFLLPFNSLTVGEGLEGNLGPQ